MFPETEMAVEEHHRQTFRDEDLRGRDLSRHVFVDCEFRDCDLSGTEFGSSHHTRSTFYRCWSSGRPTSFEGATLEECELEGCQLPNVIFRAADLTKARIVGCSFPGGRLSGCILDESRIRDLRIPGTRLDRCSFRKATLDDDIRYRPVRRLPYLRGVSFFGPSSSRTMIHRRIDVTGATRGCFVEFCLREARRDRLFEKVADLKTPQRALALLGLLAYGLTSDFGHSLGRWLLTVAGVVALLALVRLRLDHADTYPEALAETVRASVLQAETGAGVLDVVQMVLGLFVGGILVKMATDAFFGGSENS